MARVRSMLGALDAALRARSATDPVDVAAVTLARQYAQLIDADPDQLPRVGPRLYELLAELRMTPRARASAPPPAPVAVPAGEAGESGGGGDVVSIRRTALRELRGRRQNRAAAMDPPAS